MVWGKSPPPILCHIIFYLFSEFYIFLSPALIIGILLKVKSCSSHERRIYRQTRRPLPPRRTRGRPRDRPRTWRGRPGARTRRRRWCCPLPARSGRQCSAPGSETTTRAQRRPSSSSGSVCGPSCPVDRGGPPGTHVTYDDAGCRGNAERKTLGMLRNGGRSAGPTKNPRGVPGRSRLYVHGGRTRSSDWLAGRSSWAPPPPPPSDNRLLLSFWFHHRVTQITVIIQGDRFAADRMTLVLWHLGKLT